MHFEMRSPSICLMHVMTYTSDCTDGIWVTLLTAANRALPHDNAYSSLNNASTKFSGFKAAPHLSTTPSGTRLAMEASCGGFDVLTLTLAAAHKCMHDIRLITKVIWQCAVHL